MRGLLESGLRVIQRRRPSVASKNLLAAQEAASRLGDVEGGQGVLDPKAMLGLLESGLRAIDGCYNESRKRAGKEGTRKFDERKEQLELAATPAELLDVLDRKIQRRRERRKQSRPTVPAADLHKRKRQRRRERTKQKAYGSAASDPQEQRRELELERGGRFRWGRSSPITRAEA